MRKRLVPGLKNSQRIRFIIDGFGFFCTVEDLWMNTGTTSHATALQDAVFALASSKSDPGPAGKACIGIAGTWRGHNVQIDLCQAHAKMENFSWFEYLITFIVIYAFIYRL